MTARALALAVLLAMLAPTMAAAAEEDLGGWISREAAAKAAGAGARAKALEEENSALKAENAELRAGRDAALKLVDITEKIAEAQDRLRQLSEEERAAWKGKAERLEKEKGKGRLWLRVQAWGATGAALGTPFGLPGVAAGALIGGGVGAVVGLFESP